MSSDQKSFVVDEKYDRQRLDVFLAGQIRDLTRSRIKELIEKEFVRVEGHPTKASYKIKPGEKIDLEIPEIRNTELAAQQIDLDVLFEDSDIIVVNKPAGMVVHPAAGNPDGTLVNALLAQCDDLSGIGGELRPGIVHRLDKGTSGVILAAKNDRAHQDLSRQFAARTVKKEYRALVFGKPSPPAGTWDKPIGRHPVDRKKMSTRSRSPRNATTHYRVLAGFSSVSDLALVIETGRTHQIRVHCADAGHPVVMDDIYGGVRRAQSVINEDLKSLLAKLERPALHAISLEIIHPKHQKKQKFEASIPRDMQDIIELIKANK